MNAMNGLEREPILDPQKGFPGPTLDDAVDTPTTPTERPGAEASAGAMTAEQVVGMVALLSSLGLPPERAERYRHELAADGSLVFMLEILEVADALAEYGISNAGKMPAWLRLVLGAGIVGFTVMAARGKYAKTDADDRSDTSSGSAAGRADDTSRLDQAGAIAAS